MNNSSQFHLQYLKLAVPDLEAYLLSPTVFWPLPSAPTSLNEPGMDQMTLGGVILSLKVIQAFNLPEAMTFSDLVEDVRERWRSNWAKKAAKEFSQRVRNWEHTVGELTRQTAGRLNVYRAQVRNRVILELLKDEMPPERPSELAVLASLDTTLRNLFVQGDFLWDSSLQSVFPQPRYWFLYLISVQPR